MTGNRRPPTIHDFGGFPPELYEMQYPAPGDPALAERVRGLTGAPLREDWGLDHGTWSVLVHLLPGAEVPVKADKDQLKSSIRTSLPLRIGMRSKEQQLADGRIQDVQEYPTADPQHLRQRRTRSEP